MNIQIVKNLTLASATLPAFLGCAGEQSTSQKQFNNVVKPVAQALLDTDLAFEAAIGGYPNAARYASNPEAFGLKIDEYEFRKSLPELKKNTLKLLEEIEKAEDKL